jgi:uncharacterized protein YkwD
MAVAAAAHGPPTQASAPTLPTLTLTRLHTFEDELLAAANAERTRHGLRPLRYSRGLHRAAALHSAEMARLGYFDHDSADGTSFARRIRRTYRMRGYRRWGVGENLVSGSPTLSAAEALSEWLQSPGHRANLLSRRWRDAGLGAVYVVPAPGQFGGLPTVVVTLDFGYRRR